MLNLVPFARARRIVAYLHGYPQAIGQSLQMNFLGRESGPAAAPGIRADQQTPSLRVSLASQQLPPAENAGHGKFRRLVRDADVDHGFVPRQIAGPVGEALPTL